LWKSKLLPGSQAVRQGPLKPPSVGSNPTQATLMKNEKGFDGIHTFEAFCFYPRPFLGHGGLYLIGALASRNNVDPGMRSRDQYSIAVRR
jgi:hypothetical protein